MNKYNIIKLKSISSTNDYASSNFNSTNNKFMVVVAQEQTSGRGQGSNKWESQKDKNLLASIAIKNVCTPINMQYYISMIGALAIYNTLKNYDNNFSLKWPNDIYWKDYKISGTLIETSIAYQKIKKCILGMGININQETFYSNAPNPISLINIIKKETCVSEFLDVMLKNFDELYNKLEQQQYKQIKEQYLSVLYRKDKFYLYKDATHTFKAQIIDVKDNGHLVLEDENKIKKEYEFKEIKFII